VSPKPAKTKNTSIKKHGKSDTGVVAAMDEDPYIDSTDISSPIRTAPRSRKGKMRADDAPDEPSEDEDFEPIREAKRRSALVRNRSPLGPPITSDQRLVEANVSEVHQDIIQHFVMKAKGLDEKFRNQNGRKKPYFTEDNLREMAINWTTSLEDMMEIRDINKENVLTMGKRLLPCLQQYHDQYEEMMLQREDRDIDENHQNVIDLVTDEEDRESDYGQQSGYFERSAEVIAFNESVALAGTQTQQVQMRTIPPKQKVRTMLSGRGSRAGSSGGSRGARSSGRGDFRTGSRRGSGGFPKGRSAARGSSGISKRSSTNKRSSNGSTASAGSSNILKSSAKKPGGGGGADGGFGGIVMMRT
jgi:bloom syndrome protein